MIVSRTPLRVSFVGGGSDLPSFYEKSKGAVVSVSIDKYMYIMVNRKFDNKIRISYSTTEICDKLTDIRHDIVRESLKYLKIKDGIEITSVSDVPSEGTGLGSSSAYCVGLLKCLYEFLGRKAGKHLVAADACKIEIQKCRKPIGKQDQYACCFGGLNYIEFFPKGVVKVTPIKLQKSLVRKLNNRILVFYTGVTRASGTILREQSRKMMRNDDKFASVKKMVEYAGLLRDELNKGNLDSFGKILDLNWKEKRKLTDGISNPQIDLWYEMALKAGAVGGKLLGAGGGGFLLFYVPEDRQASVINKLSFLRHYPINFEFEGSKIIYE